MLRIKRSRFFELLSRYTKDPDNFSIQYKKETSNYRINPKIETSIIQELIIFRVRLHKFTKCKTKTEEENVKW